MSKKLVLAAVFVVVGTAASLTCKTTEARRWGWQPHPVVVVQPQPVVFVQPQPVVVRRPAFGRRYYVVPPRRVMW